MDPSQFLIMMGIPTGVTGLFFWLIQRKINQQDRARQNAEEERERRADIREKNREQMEMFLVKSNSASIALAEATARAVQRIPDAKCNGDMHKALEYATTVKNEQKDFLTALGLHSLHEDN